MKIVIGCDNAAVTLKNAIIELLGKQGIGVEDVGCFSPEDSIPYPLVAKLVCERVQRADGETRGMLFCGTGIGMAMTANKFKGIRAAVCHDIYSAQRSILSNNGNVLCMGARVIGPELAKVIVQEWISIRFQDCASTQKVAAITRIEENNFKQPVLASCEQL